MMTSRHLVDPELAPLLDMIPASVLTREALKQLRAAGAARPTELPPNISLAERTIPGPEGAPDIRVLVYTPSPAHDSMPALLWLHGGGYIMGSADGEAVLATALVSELGCAVVMPDYRLAPETPFPGPLEDCYATLQWLISRAAELDIDPARIAVGGSSAGGGLAAALTLLARDRGKLAIKFLFVIAPMIDDRTVVREDPNPYAGEFVWTREANRFGWTALLGHEPGGADVSPYAAAARAENLEGLPPTFINVGALDLFLEEDMDYARRLIRAGVPTELHVYPGAYHGFRMVANAQVAQAAHRDQLAALKRAFA